tara:strand:- start:353 stop:478 length:126 start_codon:yes stop_codon:yes gene_type:complete
MAVLYNPIIPVYLSRGIWLPINFISAGVYLYYYLKLKKLND